MLRARFARNLPFLRASAPLVIVGVALDGAFAFFVIVVQALLPETLGAGAGAPGFALGLYGATRVLLQLPGGILARRVGARRLLSWSLAAAALALLAVTVVRHTGEAYALTVLYGAGTALAWPAVYLLAGDQTEEERGALLGLITFAALGGMAGGLVLGALLVDLIPPRALVPAPALLLVLAAIASTRGLKAAHSGPGAGSERPSPPPRSSAFSAALLALVPALALQAIGLSMLLPLLREYALEQLGLGMHELILLGAPAGLVGAAVLLPAGRLTDRIGRTPVIAAGSAAAAGGALLLAGAESRLVFMLGAIPLAAGYAASAPALGAAIADLGDDSGRNVGLALTMQGVALAAGPVLTGLLIGGHGPALPMRVAAGMWLAAALCAATAVLRRRSAGTVEAGRGLAG